MRGIVARSSSLLVLANTRVERSKGKSDKDVTGLQAGKVAAPKIAQTVTPMAPEWGKRR